MRHIAAEGRCFIISACQVQDSPAALGLEVANWPAERPLINGGSVIVGPLGEVLAGPLVGERGLLCAEVDTDELVRARYDFDVVGHYARPDVFELSVDERPRPGVRFVGGACGRWQVELAFVGKTHGTEWPSCQLAAQHIGQALQRVHLAQAVGLAQEGEGGDAHRHHQHCFVVAADMPALVAHPGRQGLVVDFQRAVDLLCHRHAVAALERLALFEKTIGVAYLIGLEQLLAGYLGLAEQHVSLAAVKPLALLEQRQVVERRLVAGEVADGAVQALLQQQAFEFGRWRAGQFQAHALVTLAKPRDGLGQA
ncbi:hypothetical protein WR25_17286 [Diploscapter pachys]|uniref:CN hydrolase domain-containing protein n=1 Tax=Diploscapter pachys TaxID=2018661 RepID=A0A2A2K647_9BILA|nr:hypothetical protein WR25_17286 [Diploscapter pachys]